MKDIAALRKLAGCAIAYPKSSTAQDNYYLAIRPVDFILLLDRLDAAEKVCRLIEKNTGGHYCVVSKCDECHTEEVGNAGEVCWTCIEKALKEWEAAGNG